MMIVKVEAREFHRAELLEKVEQLSQELEKSRLRLHEENRQVVETLQKEYNVRRIIGRCPAMRQVVAQALAIARRPINTLILGPSGTGKEIFAKTIHYHSPRRDAPFVAVNCTAIPDSLFESEMFGIEKGVATGVSARRGLVEEASGGTLFLDELADMSLPNQAKLLRVLEEREVLRVGSARPVPVDIKVIAATNVDLRQAVARGRFREDLYYRLNVAELTLPPLRERGDDILLLARHLLAQHAHNMERAALTLAPATQQCLLAYDWPGNVRELKHAMERACAASGSGRILARHLPTEIRISLAKSRLSFPGASFGDAPSSSPSHPGLTSHEAGDLLPSPQQIPHQARKDSFPTLRESRARADAEYLEALLARFRGDVRRAASAAGISRGHLYELLKKHGLARDGADSPDCSMNRPSPSASGH